ncbi:hypothetical protein ScPMuIL_011505 [Solemya velum]
MSGTQKTVSRRYPDYTEHNQSTYNELERGDLVEFDRGRYSHWGVYVGDGHIVHMTGDGNDGINANFDSGKLFTICGTEFNKAFVKKDNFWDVTQDSKAIKNNSKDRKCNPLSAEEIVERALARIGNITYNVLWKNCEHFAAWCRYDVEWSEQANKFLSWLSVGALAVSAFGIIFGAARHRRPQHQ